MATRPVFYQPISWPISTLIIVLFLCACRGKAPETLPATYQRQGDYVKTLPYFNPDSCVLLIRRDVPSQWQGAVYENLFLNGPEDSPLELGFKHLDTYEKNFPSDTAREFAQFWRGRLYTHLGKLDSAMLCLQDAYERSNRNQRYLHAMDAQEGMAMLHQKSGDIGAAIRAHLVSFDAAKRLDATQNTRKYTTGGNLSAAYFASNNPREALDWMHCTAPYVFDETHPILPELKVDYFKQIAVIYSELEMADSALFFAQKAIEFHDKNKTNADRSRLLHVLGGAYLKKGDCITAHQYLLEAYKDSRGNIPSAKGNLLAELADAYLCLGKRDSAKNLYQTALALPVSLPTRNHVQSQLSGIYATENNYKAAFTELSTVREIQAKMFNPQKVQAIGAMRAELELELEKRKSIEIQQEIQIVRQRTLTMALCILLAIGLLIGLVLRQRAQQQILAQQTKVLEQEKSLLAQEKALAEAREVVHLQELEYTKANLQNTNEALEQTAALLSLKNDLIEKMESKVADSPQTSEPAASKEPDIATLRHIKILTDEDWRDFQERFEQVFPGIKERIKVLFPNVTEAERRLFLLQKAGLLNREIAEALGISIESVWKSRQRLKKKLGFGEEKNFYDFVQGF